MSTLRTLSVQHCAEDNEQLLELYKNTTKYFDAELEGTGSEKEWIAPDPFLVWGPFDHTAAIIVNGNGGVVSILKGNDCIKSYPDGHAVNDVTMVFLEVGFYCWSMKGSLVKFIKRSGT